ncbi:hypothetical protein J0910_28410 [Nocardiopsis sp. CNT-189]|uniref:hypothetical protein n=1 Tax=Nocardiopsis oceanisediminis TaxID=2816862 RepID=UPI003B3536C8
MPPTRRHRALAALGALALAAALHTAERPAAAGPLGHPAVVGRDPADWTPHVLDGAVKSIVRVGGTVYAAGSFERVSPPDRSRTLHRSGVFAFEHGTGRILDFAPEVDGTVASLAAADGGVFIGGSFTEVNGAERRGAALLTSGGRLRPGFDARLDGGSVYRLARHGGSLYLAGSFRSAGGSSGPGLARVDAGTGAADPSFAVRIAEPRRGTLRVQDMALSPDGRRLVAGGTFTRVDGEPRPQIAMVDTAASPARLADWSTEAYAAPCDHSRMHTYIRQIDFAPDGSYFAVAATGGPDPKPGLCKAVARWESDGAAGSEPTWVNRTGGDSLYAVAATGAAVYVGGHQRWMDNPEGRGDAGPGAVPREGIAAVDPETGKALPWNPGRARGHGVEALTATEDGLYVGSDTTRLGGERRDRIGMFPLPS